MENKKVSLSTVFLVIVIILIIVMGALLYIQKTEADRKITELENNASKLQEKIDDLQGKIDSISNTINDKERTEEIKFDTTIDLKEIKNLDYSNKSRLQSFHNKYEGKIVKITGYVNGVDDNVLVTSVDTAETVIYIGNSSSDENWIVSGSSADLNVRKQINDLKLGQKVSIVGIVNKGAQPIELNGIKIIVEQLETQIGQESSETNEFASNEPKISFQYPKDWIIETNNWSIWNRTVKAPQDGIKITITKEENKDNQELKDLLHLDWGSNVLSEGTLSINNYKAYYKTYTFADAKYSIKAKDVIIDTGKGDYYSISLNVGGEKINISREEAYEKYESVLSNLLSSLQF